MSDITSPARSTQDYRADVARDKRRASIRKNVWMTLRVALILLVVFIFTFPFIWMALASFQNQIDIISPDLAFTPTMRNYDNVFNQYNFLQFMWNSFVVATLATLMSLILGLPAAYAVARFHYDWLGVVLLAARIVPGITFLVPWYILFSAIGLNGSYIALILSHMLVSMPFVVWVMVPFFEGMPFEIEESARIDGATLVGTFVRIVLPLAVPAIVTAAIMSFLL
jgi:multiple sugar transport system permease protein